MRCGLTRKVIIKLLALNSQESSITEAVERQLKDSQGGGGGQAAFALTPQMGKKQHSQSQSHASSEHAGTPLSDTGTVSSAKQLSSFVANKGVAINTPTSIPSASSVQMRRTTNKRGKQAPAPPKRTRYVFEDRQYLHETL